MGLLDEGMNSWIPIRELKTIVYKKILEKVSNMDILLVNEYM